MTFKEKTVRLKVLLEKGELSLEERDFVDKHTKTMQRHRENSKKNNKDPELKRKKSAKSKADRLRLKQLRKKEFLTESERIWLDKAEAKAVAEKRRGRQTLSKQKELRLKVKEILLKKEWSPEEALLVEKAEAEKKRKRATARLRWKKNNERINRRVREDRLAWTPEKKLKVSTSAAAYRRERCSKDLAFRLLARVRTRVGMFLKRTDRHTPERGTGFQKHFGTTKEAFFDHINSLLLDGMTWENYGKVWHLDHIVPLSLCGGREERLAKLTNYKNLQPLFAIDNIRKGNSMPSIWPEGVPFTREEVESWAKG